MIKLVHLLSMCIDAIYVGDYVVVVDELVRNKHDAILTTSVIGQLMIRYCASPALLPDVPPRRSTLVSSPS